MASETQFRGPLEVEYCPVCSLPPEYCEFGPSFDKCRVQLQKNHPDLLAAALEKMQLAGGSSSSAPSADDAKESEGAEGGEKKEADADDELLAAAAPIKEKKKAKEVTPGIYLSLTQRSKRKFTTIVKGWESYGLVLKDVAKLMSKKFACSASVVKAADGSGEIVLQGDLLMDLPHWIVEEFEQVDERQIWTVDKAGKKVRAF